MKTIVVLLVLAMVGTTIAQWSVSVLPGPPPGHPAHSTVRIMFVGDTLNIVTIGRLGWAGVLAFGQKHREGRVEWEVIDTLFGYDSHYDPQNHPFWEKDGWSESVCILLVGGQIRVIYESRDRQALVMATRLSLGRWVKQDICFNPHPTLIDAINKGDSIFIAFHTIVGTRCSFCVCRGTVSGNWMVDTVESSDTFHYDYPSLGLATRNSIWVSFVRLGQPTRHLVASRGEGWTVFEVLPARYQPDFPVLVLPSDSSSNLHFLRNDGLGINHLWGLPGAWLGDVQIDSLGIVPRVNASQGSIFTVLFRAGFEPPNYKDIFFTRLDSSGQVREREIILVFGPYDQMISHGFDLAVASDGSVHMVANVMSYDSGYHVLYYCYRPAAGVVDEEMGIPPRESGLRTEFMLSGQLPTGIKVFDTAGRQVHPTEAGVYYRLDPKGGRLRRIILVR